MWHILGVGALGSLWARRLHLAGEQVTLLLRDAQAVEQFYQQGGVLRFSQQEEIEAYAFNARCLASLTDPIEHLLICTKSHSLESAFNSAHTRIHSNTEVLILANGYGPQQYIRASYSSLKIWGASTTDGAYRSATNLIHIAAEGETLIGPLTQTAAGLPLNWNSLPGVSLIDDIDTVLWQKLAVNGCINPLSVKYDCLNGELLDGGEREEHLTCVALEIETLSDSLNRPLFKTSLIEEVRRVAKLTGSNVSSMLQDRRAGRQTEINQISGTLCTAGKQSGIALPENEALLLFIQQSEQGSTPTE